MIQHVWSVVARRSIIDKDTNTLSLIDIAETLQVPEEAGEDSILAGVEQLDIVSLWSRADINIPVGISEGKVLYFRPNGDLGYTAEFQVDLSKFHLVRTRWSIHGLAIRSLGRMIFEVQIQQPDSGEWESVAKLPIDVIREIKPVDTIENTP